MHNYVDFVINLV